MINLIQEPFGEGDFFADDGTGFIDPVAWWLSDQSVIDVPETEDREVTAYEYMAAKSTKVMKFFLRDSLGNIIVPDGPITWTAEERAGDSPKLTKSIGQGIAVGGDGGVIVTIDPNDTTDMSGVYQQEIKFKIGTIVKERYIGILEVGPSSIQVF